MVRSYYSGLLAFGRKMNQNRLSKDLVKDERGFDVPKTHYHEQQAQTLCNSTYCTGMNILSIFGKDVEAKETLSEQTGKRIRLRDTLPLQASIKDLLGFLNDHNLQTTMVQPPLDEHGQTAINEALRKGKPLIIADINGTTLTGRHKSTQTYLVYPIKGSDEWMVADSLDHTGSRITENKLRIKLADGFARPKVYILEDKPPVEKEAPVPHFYPHPTLAASRMPATVTELHRRGSYVV